MSYAKQGDHVQVHYTGRLADNTIFDSSLERDPLEFTIGAGQVIPGFEQVVLGMQPGDTRQVTVLATDAYGPYQDELRFEIERALFPAGVSPAVGQFLQIPHPDGQTLVVFVAEVSPAHVTLDANHPLAGQDLAFEIALLAILADAE